MQGPLEEAKATLRLSCFLLSLSLPTALYAFLHASATLFPSPTAGLLCLFIVWTCTVPGSALLDFPSSGATTTCNTVLVAQFQSSLKSRMTHLFIICHSPLEGNLYFPFLCCFRIGHYLSSEVGEY